MARIGTWRKIRQVGSDLYEYENSSGTRIKVAQPPTQTGWERRKDEWYVSILSNRSFQPTYLAGGNSGLHKCSKSKAFRLARTYMKEHPGRSRKPLKCRRCGHAFKEPKLKRKCLIHSEDVGEYDPRPGDYIGLGRFVPFGGHY